MYSKNVDILPRTVSLFNSEATPTDMTSLLKVALQLLGNVCIGCPDGQERVWQLCFPQHFRLRIVEKLNVDHPLVAILETVN